MGETAEEHPASATEDTTPSSRDLQPYQYDGLDPNSNSIRLVTILPGSGTAPIVVRIHHDSLPELHVPASTFRSKITEELQESIPDDWDVAETWYGRLIFINYLRNIYSWHHPSSENDALEGEPGSTEMRASTEINSPYEAIKYTWGSPESKMVYSLKDLNLEDHTVDECLNSPDAPSYYEALSYAWGSPETTEKIMVKLPNGQFQVLPVTENLAAALGYLRYSDESRTLWIDAICINQQDVSERSEQVTKMPSVYRLAARVVVWLGLGSAQSRLALSTLHHLGQQVEVLRELRMARSPDAVQNGSHDEENWYKRVEGLPYDQETWDAILSFFKRSWFSRVWVMQEVSMAVDGQHVIQCGDDTIPWKDFRKAVVCLYSKPQFLSTDLKHYIDKVVKLVIYERSQALWTSWEWDGTGCVAIPAIGSTDLLG